MNKGRTLRLGTAAVMIGAMCFISGCCKKITGDSSEDETLPASGSATAAATASPPKEDPGPSVAITAGTLVAGTKCQKTPRITNEELEGVNIQMGEFTIDAYPYPNDPSQSPRTGVTRDEADSLCKARGRRLCTELEWERACKGPGNTTYPYGESFQASKCSGSSNLLKPAGQYDACSSAFGVKAVYGAVWEWTASEWGRGGPGGMATVRGGGHKNPAVRHRCANGQSRSTSETSADLGFRCCGGPFNPATVHLELDKRSPIVADPGVDPTLAARLMQALPSNMRKVSGFIPAIDRVWRWHPRDNEEMIVARYRAKRAAGAGQFFHPVVFHLCGNSTVRVAKLRGPVEKMETPTVGGNPQRISVRVETGSDKGEVKFAYHYGNVSVTQPSWVKQGNSLSVGRRLVVPGVKLRLPGKR
jgi:Sulfatase-modifying factor enzyme 1